MTEFKVGDNVQQRKDLSLNFETIDKGKIGTILEIDIEDNIGWYVIGWADHSTSYHPASSFLLFYEKFNEIDFKEQRCKHINGSTPINGYIICKICGQNLRKAGF